MNRLFLLLLMGAIAFPGVGCATRVRKQLQQQHLIFAQEYRLLEDELFQAYQELDHLERLNENLRSRLESDSQESEAPLKHDAPKRNAPRLDAPRRTQDAPPRSTAPKFHPPQNGGFEDSNGGNTAPQLDPISTEGIEPSDELPQIMQNRATQRLRNHTNSSIYPLPQTNEPQPIQTHYSTVPLWSPHR